MSTYHSITYNSLILEGYIFEIGPTLALATQSISGKLYIKKDDKLIVLDSTNGILNDFQFFLEKEDPREGLAKGDMNHFRGKKPMTTENTCSTCKFYGIDNDRWGSCGKYPGPVINGTVRHATVMFFEGCAEWANRIQLDAGTVIDMENLLKDFS